MKFIKKLLLIIVLLIVLLIIGRNVIVKYCAPIGAHVAIGHKMSLGDVNIGLTDALIGITDIKIMNPKGFPIGHMVNIKEVYIDPVVADILKDKIHLVEVRFDLDNLVIIKNKDGEFNFKKLTEAKKKQDGESVEKEKPAKKGKKKELQIDLLKFRLGTVVYKDYSKGSEPKITTFNINLDSEYNDITDPAVIGSIIFSKIMMNTSLSALSGIDMDSINDVLDVGTDQLKGLQESVLGKDTAEKVNKSVGDSVDKAVKSIKNIF